MDIIQEVTNDQNHDEEPDFCQYITSRWINAMKGEAEALGTHLD